MATSVIHRLFFLIDTKNIDQKKETRGQEDESDYREKIAFGLKKITQKTKKKDEEENKSPTEHPDPLPCPLELFLSCAEYRHSWRRGAL